MRYWYDTEFLEDGQAIELISIGIVAEDGREYYAVNSDMPIERIRKDDWLLRNVMPSIPVTGKNLLDRYCETTPNVHPHPSVDLVGPDLSDSRVKPRWVIRNEVRDFLLADPSGCELWAWYAAYDHVALAQLFGKMIHLPEGIPMFTHDVRQLVTSTGYDKLPKQRSREHDALEDARHVRVMHQWIESHA